MSTQESATGTSGRNGAVTTSSPSREEMIRSSRLISVPLTLSPSVLGIPWNSGLDRKNSVSPPRIWARTSSGTRARCICFRVSRGFPA